MRLDLLFTYRFAVRLHERFNDGWTSTAALYEELQPLGYRGSYRSVRDYVRPLRTIGAAPAERQFPKARRITSWMCVAWINPTDHEQIGLKQILASCQISKNCWACRIFCGDAPDALGNN